MAQHNIERSTNSRQHPDQSGTLTRTSAPHRHPAPAQTGPGPAANDDDRRFQARIRRSAQLNHIVKAEILPRLALAHATAAAKQTEATIQAGATTEGDTTALIRLLLGADDRGAQGFVDSLEARGATPASLYVGIITQAVRRLGELWDEDRCNLAQFAISLGRMQLVVRALSPSFQMSAVVPSALASTVLLLPAPGEQHTIGLMILAEFFQRDGWYVTGGPVSTGYDPVATVRNGLVDVIGFSIGSLKGLDRLTACITAVRNASRNPYLGVLVGGPLLLRRPDLMTRVGADAAVVDAPEAIRQARTLLTMQPAAD